MNKYPDSYADAIDPRCIPIGTDHNAKYDGPSPIDERCRNHSPESIPSDLLEKGAYYNEYGFLVIPKSKPIIPEEVEDF